MSTETAAPATRTRWQRVRSHPLFHLFVALVLLAILQGFFVKMYQVPSGSMEPTLQVDGALSDRFLVNRLAYVGSSPEPGDVVVFSRPESWGESPDRSTLRTIAGAIGDVVGFGPSNQDALVKRVLAVGGDTIECCDESGEVLRNGDPVPEPYVVSNAMFEPGRLDCGTEPASPRCFPEIAVPDGKLVMMGDNRANSSDSISRCRGGTEEIATTCARYAEPSDITGRAFAVVFPFSHWTTGLSADVEAEK